MFVVALAVLREGPKWCCSCSEWARADPASPRWRSAGRSAVAGAAVGVALYFGLLGIPIRHFFTATNWMVLLLAAGLRLAGRAFHPGRLLPALGERVWDTSWLLSNDSLAGQTLRTLIGYDARPAGMQLLFYATTALLILIGMKTWGSTSEVRSANR